MPPSEESGSENIDDSNEENMADYSVLNEDEKTMKTDEKNEPLSPKDREYDALSAPKDSINFYDLILRRQHEIRLQQDALE